MFGKSETRCELLIAACFLMLVVSGQPTLAGQATAQDLAHAAPQQAAELVFTDLKDSVVEAVPYKYGGFETGVTFFMKPHSLDEVCEVQAIDVSFKSFNHFSGDEGSVVLTPNEVSAGMRYYVPDTSTSCLGPVGSRAVFEAGSVVYAQIAVQLLAAVIHAAGSPKELPFVVEIDCQDKHPTCDRDHIKSELAGLDPRLITGVSEVGWFETDGTGNTVLEINVAERDYGHWTLRIAFEYGPLPRPFDVSDIQKIQIHWYDTRPMP